MQAKQAASSESGQARVSVLSGLSLAVLSVVVALPAYALGDPTTVDKVDVRYDSSGPDVLYVHLNDSIKEVPGNGCSHSKIVGCELSLDFCQAALKVALAAQVSGKPIDYSASTVACKGPDHVTALLRIRIEN